MAHKEASEKSGYIVDVKIVDVEKRYYEGPKHYVYVVKVTRANPANVFIIYRRYAQFFDLQCQLLDLFAETPSEANDDTQSRKVPFLPGKILLGRSQVRQIALERKQVLTDYCQNLISLSEHISRSRPILEFFHPSSTDIQRPVDAAPLEKKQVDVSSLVISGPAQLASYRCLADFAATEKLEMSLKRNNIVQVLQKHDNGWWFVQFGDQTGFVPGTYLEPSELKRGVREGKTTEKSLNEKHIVKSTFKGTGKDELSLEQGSFVTVMEKSLTGWWKVKFNNLTGHFPAVCLTSCDGRHTPEQFPDDESSSTSKKKDLNKSSDSDGEDEDDYRLDPSKASEPELFYAHRDFNDKIGDCLSFKRGDIIEIHDKHRSGWWFGRRMKGDPILSWVPESYLQKEPIMESSVKNNNSQPWNSKSQIKTSEKISSPVMNTQQKEDKAKVSTPTVRKIFPNQPATNHVDQSNVTQKQQPIATSTVPKTSHLTIPAAFRPVNDKQETTTAAKSSPVTSSPLFRPVGVKQDTASTTPKGSPISTATALRPIGGKQETTSTPKSSSAATSSAFRPVNNKPEAASASKHSSNTTSTAFRPVIGKQETATTQKKPPVVTSTPLRSTNAKQEPTQKLVKDLVGKFNDK